MSNQQLSDELHKSSIRKIKRGKVYPYSKDKIWRVDLADTLIISKKKNKGIQILLCVIDIFD